VTGRQASSAQGGQDFKDLLERCLRQAGLSTRNLHLGLLREVRQDVPENTIDSWRRPHSTTGQPTLPREPVVRTVAGWLCSRDEVSVTEEELLSAWQSDRAARALKRSPGGATEETGRLPDSPAPTPEGVTAAPQGVVTFVCARISQQGGVHGAESEAAGSGLLADIVVTHGGVKLSSDRAAFMASFAEAADALRAAAEVQRAIEERAWPEGVPPRMSIAVHTGPVASTSTGYAGLAVHQAGRMSSAAHPGQVVVSEAARNALGPALPEAASLVDLGRARLKDLSMPQRLFELPRAGNQAGFPALRTLDAYPHNLPLQLTSFIGRVEELAKLRQTLASSRLCTLTGSGGSGKTRLALQVAAELIEDFADGVWLVDLAPTLDCQLVVQAIASALNVREGGTGTYAARAKRHSRRLVDRVSDHLRYRHVLLILDNCEHVVEACAPLVEALLQACPDLRVLCTSREPLGVAGELVHRVPPLAVPPTGQVLSEEEITGYESVRLFLDRAAQRRPEPPLTASDIQAVMKICQRVEGLALAIELAAARVKMLSACQIRELLEDRFDLLSSDRRTVTARHQTLRAMIDWSYEDLSESQQSLLRRLAVFVGGFELAAAQQVCSGEGLERFEILDLLGMLIDKSLVETDQHVGVVRYRLLETIRAYGREKLAQSGEAQRFRERHRGWYLARAEEAEPALMGPNQLRWLELLELDHDNLRAALELETAPGETEEPLRLAAALGHFWLVRGLLSEGRHHLERALANDESGGTVLRAKALAVAGNLAMFDADVAAAAEHSQRALELSAALGYRRGEAWALRTLGRVAGAGERPAEARALQEEAVAISRELSDGWGTAFSLTNLANLDALEGRFSEADDRYEESLTIRRAIGDAWGLVWSLFRLGMLRTWQGRFDDAHRLFDDGLELCGRLRYGGGTMLTLLGRGDAAHLGGDQAAAEASYTEALSKARDLEDQTGISLSVVGLANVATASGHFAAAARWLGSEEATYASSTVSTHAARLRAEARLAADIGDGQAIHLHAQALRLHQRLGDVRAMIEELEDVATLLVTSGSPERARLLMAAAGSSRSTVGAPVLPLYRDESAAVRAALDMGEADACAGSWTRSPPSLDEAVTLALSSVAGHARR
jgi:predicted ATPase